MTLKQLLETYEDTVKVSNSGRVDTSGVYVNPSKKEMEEASLSNKGGRSTRKGAIRFIATPNKKVYVFGANLIPDEVTKKIKLPSFPKVFEGIAEFKDGKWVLTRADGLNLLVGETKGKNPFMPSVEDLEKHLSTDWSFINKYISLQPYMTKMTEKLTSEALENVAEKMRKL